GLYGVTAIFTSSDPNYTGGATLFTLFEIIPKAATVTANSMNKTYGTALIFAGTEFTTSGLVSGDTVTSATLSSPGAGAAATVAGSPYTITITKAMGTGLGNYSISY